MRAEFYSAGTEGISGLADAVSVTSRRCAGLKDDTMKMLSGSVLLLAAEQAFAHAQLTQFPNHEDAATVLIPASVVFLSLGSILWIWGLLCEIRGGRGRDVQGTSKVDAG